MSDDAPWLSLLLPVYNVASYLEECVDSVLAQKVGGIEVIVLDDASTDGSSNVIESIVARHGAVVRSLRHPVNRGLSAARNALGREASGDYVWFLDSDDLLCPGALAGLRAAIAAGAPDLLLCDFRMVRDDFGLKHRLRGELHRSTFRGAARRVSTDRSALVAGLLAQGQLHAWTKIAKRRVWRAAMFQEGRYFEDIAVIPALLQASRTYCHVPEPWVGYRQREASILAAYTSQKIRDQLQSLRELHEGIIAMAELDAEAVFATQHFCLKSLASLARTLDRQEFTDKHALLEECRATLAGMFPDGVGPILRGYLRRGWLLRAQRTRQSLQRVGLA